MRYSFDFTVPASTPATAPVVKTITLDVGRVEQIIIRFKAGCHNRVSVAIFASLEQIVPAKATLALYGNNVIIPIPMQHEMDAKPYQLLFKGWSPDTRYPHVISVWLDLLERPDEKRTGILESFTHLLKGQG